MEKNRGLIMKILTVLFVFIVSVFSINFIRAEGEPLTNKVTFTANKDETIYPYYQQLNVDLFKLGTISFDQNKYSITFDEAFKNLESIKNVNFNEIDLTNLDDAAKMLAITNEITGTILNSNIERAYSKSEKNEGILVDSNTIYIAFPHNIGVTKDDYIKKSTDYYSVASFDGNDFRFTPNLIFVVEEDLPVTLKATALANLEIEKELDSYAGSPISFVFEIIDVTDTDNSKVIAVTSLSFDNYGKKKAIVKNIPVGHKITVTESYSGASYKIDGNNSVTIDSITTEGKNGVIFKNSNDSDITKGNGADNRFEYQETNEWQFKDKTIVENGSVKTITAGGANG